MKKEQQLRARSLRRSQTDVENKLWYYLRNRKLSGCKFRRQHVIDHYIVDFCCPEKMLIVELDGGQHNKDRKRDEQRTWYLNEKGYEVLRFWNHEVLQNTEAVLEKIRLVLLEPHPNPLLSKERG